MSTPALLCKHRAEQLWQKQWVGDDQEGEPVLLECQVPENRLRLLHIPEEEQHSFLPCHRPKPVMAQKEALGRREFGKRKKDRRTEEEKVSPFLEPTAYTTSFFSPFLVF